MNFGFLRDLVGKNFSMYNKVVVAGAKVFWVEELRVRQVKIGHKSCFIA